MFSDSNKIIAAICAAPAFLGKLNLLKKNSFTCFPGYEISRLTLKRPTTD
ncbi:MAG: DJ-1/PfpI family protein [Candidatus Phytoplasma australasiaticum]|nr:DJ-1/PfpI family protein [Candidatus Phytoplasma australasiaticum]